MVQGIERLSRKELSEIDDIIKNSTTIRKNLGHIEEYLVSDETIIGKKRSILQQIILSIRKEGTLSFVKWRRNDKTKQKLEELLEVISKHIKHALDAKQHVHKNSIGLKDIMHMISYLISAEEKSVAVDQNIKHAISKRMQEIEADKQHMIQNHQIFEQFKQVYAETIEEKKDVEKEQEEFTEALHEQKLIEEVYNGFMHCLNEQRRVVEEIISDLHKGKKESVERLIDEMSTLISQERTKTALLMNYAEIQKHILIDADGYALRIQTLDKRKKVFFHSANILRKRAVAIAVIIALSSSAMFGNRVTRWMFPQENPVSESIIAHEDRSIGEIVKIVLGQFFGQTVDAAVAGGEVVAETSLHVALKGIELYIDHLEKKNEFSARVLEMILNTFKLIFRNPRLGLFLLVGIITRTFIATIPLAGKIAWKIDKNFITGMILIFKRDFPSATRWFLRNITANRRALEYLEKQGSLEQFEIQLRNHLISQLENPNYQKRLLKISRKALNSH